MREGDVVDGRYRVDEKLGQGGMGLVYRGYDQVLNKTVAIKVLFSNTPDLVIKRFHAEAIALGQLQHPNILSVQHFGQSREGVLYLVTDFIQGESLSALIEKRCGQTFFDVLPIFEKICRGLRYAHANNVLHRDIKPSNVMLDTDPSKNDSVKLVDFGLAKQADKDFDLTKSGTTMGTPGYMSPEAIHGQEVDARSDIYALGCTFFEMLTGRTPFAEENVLKLMMSHLNSVPPSLSEVTDRPFDKEVEDFVQRCLAKEPDDRFQDMDELIGELKDVEKKLLQKKESMAGHPSRIYESTVFLREKVKRADLTLKILVLTVSVLVVVTAGGAIMNRHPVQKKPLESAKSDKAVRDGKAEFKNIGDRIKQHTIQESGWSGVTLGTGADGETCCFVIGKLTDQEVRKKIEPYKNVPNFALRNLTVSQEALDYILELPIVTLTVYKVPMTNEFAKRISSMKHLKGLAVSNCGDLPVNFFANFKGRSLSTLIFEPGKNHEHPGVELAALNDLEKVTMVRARLQRADIRAMAEALDLKSLTLGRCTLSLDALVDLKRLKNCVAFTLTEGNLSPQQFEDISKIQSMVYLNLSVTNLNDRTLIKYFSRCKRLRRLILIDTSVTPAGVEGLAASVPGVKAVLEQGRNDDPY